MPQPACFPPFHVKTFLDRVSPRYRNQLALLFFMSKPSWIASHPDIATSLLSPFHPKTFLDRVSPRYRTQLAFLFSPQNLPGTRSDPISQPACFPLFMSKPSWIASHPDIAASLLCSFSCQNLPGSRLTPISQPACFALFHVKTFRTLHDTNRVCRKTHQRFLPADPVYIFTDLVYGFSLQTWFTAPAAARRFRRGSRPSLLLSGAEPGKHP